MYMSYDIPTPKEIKSRLNAEAALTTGSQHASLPGTAENMYTSVATVLSYELYSFISYLSQQIIPTTADTDFLERHAGFYLSNPRKPSGKSTGPVDVIGTNGTLIPSGSILVRADGQTYSLDADVTVGVDGTAVGNVTAENAGSLANTSADVSLSLESTIIGITSISVSDDGLSGGTEVENDTSVLNRLLTNVQTPPQGGSLKDYETWAKEVSGVTRAWARESDDGIMTVHLTFVMDDKEDTPIPTANEVEIVEDYISGLRPAGARPDINAPVQSAVNLSIELSPNTVAVQDAIKAELEDFFFREATAGGSTLHLSRISEVISAGAGENYHKLISPVASLTFAFGTLPVLGAITWSSPA